MGGVYGSDGTRIRLQIRWLGCDAALTSISHQSGKARQPVHVPRSVSEANADESLSYLSGYDYGEKCGLTSRSQLLLPLVELDCHMLLALESKASPDGRVHHLIGM